jgi:predicted regulator of Ras-like GTPase activity (Roadblock/LC7/MglB family)
MSFGDVLATLLAAPGARSAAFLDPQGQPIASAGDSEALETLAAYQSVWLGELGRAARRSGLGALNDLTMDFEGARVLAAEVKDGYFLCLVSERDGLLAPARARLGEAREKLAQEIG